MDSVELTVAPHEVDLASGLLWLGGVSGIEERAIDLTSVLLVAGVEPEAVDAVLAAVGSRWPLRHGVLDPTVGLDAWRPWARPVLVGGRVLIRPRWIDRDTAEGATSGGEIVISVEPGRAWGHGAHPSTTLVVEALLGLPLAGATVLDVGCGSGVLSVAAAALGATRVLGIDIDPAAIEATLDNADANRVGSIVEARATPLDQVTGSFDVVVANIGAAVLCELAEEIERRVAPGGTLVLSGLLVDQADAVAEAYAPFGRIERDRRTEQGWAALVLRA